MVLHRCRESLARDGRVRDELRLEEIQHRLVGVEHAVHDVLGQPLEVGAPGGEEVGGALGPVEHGEEGVAFLAGGVVETDV